MKLELGVDALTIIDTVARRGCEQKVYFPGHVQPCTHVNPCLTCKAKRVNDKLRVLPRHPDNRR